MFLSHLNNSPLNQNTNEKYCFFELAKNILFNNFAA